MDELSVIQGQVTDKIQDLKDIKKKVERLEFDLKESYVIEENLNL